MTAEQPERSAILVVSQDGGFHTRIQEYALCSRLNLVLNSHSDFPNLEQLKDLGVRALIVDLHYRPANTLAWLAQAKENGLSLPLLAISRSQQLSDTRMQAIYRAYGFAAWGLIDLAALTVSRFITTLQVLLINQNLPQALEALDQQSDWTDALNNLDVAVVRISSRLRLEHCNAAASKLLNVQHQSLIGVDFFSHFNFFDQKTKRSLNPLLIQRTTSQQAYNADQIALIMGKDQQPIHARIALVPINDKAFGFGGYFLVMSDLTEQQRLSTRLNYHSKHDPLTGLFSRIEFESQLQKAINSVNNQAQAAHAVEVSTHVLLFLDVDQFALVNNLCGHAVGDELLRQFSHELSRIVRKRDTLARMGGDKFGIILWGCDQATGVRIANDICRKVEEFRFLWMDKIHQLSISIGAMALTLNECTAWADALRLVENACATAKTNGRNRVELTDSRDQRMLEKHVEIEWVQRLVTALDGKGLVLFYQPIKPAREESDKPAGLHFEILVRYQHIDGSFVPPGTFLPAAERYNLMTMVDRWVIRSTLAWLKSLKDSLAMVETCSINLSGASLCEQEMVTGVKQMLLESELDLSKICFEITETVAVTNIGRATQFINQLRALGCRFALDDFGVGMSSFAYLKHLPVDYVKIDGSFVKNIVSDPIDKEMVRSINDIGHILGKKTVAEFCEDQECFDELAALGVDYIQGYFVGKPQPIGTLGFNHIARE